MDDDERDRDDWPDGEYNEDDEFDWYDHPDDVGDSDGILVHEGSGAAVLTAVFEDGPPSKPWLCIAEGFANWPPVHSWMAHDESGALIHYLYQHVGNGRYRVARTQVLEGMIELTPRES